MLFVTVFLVCLLSQSSTEPIGVKSRCNNSNIEPDVSYATFTPSVPEVQGRYTAELCTFNKPNRTHLTMDLTYKEDHVVCDQEYRKKNNRWALRPGQQHSSNTVEIAGLANCSHVCYAMDFDLIFSSCYLLKSTLKSEHMSHSPHDSYFLINNNITKEMFNKTPHIAFSNHEDYVSLDWYLEVPAVDYSVKLRRMDNATGIIYWDKSINVTQNCTLQPDVRQLFCKLAPPYGCYQASFENGGLWTSGLFHEKHYVTYDHLCHLPVIPPTVEPRSSALWWICGAALLLASGLVAATLLRRGLLLRDYHKRVAFWFNNGSRGAEVESAPTPTVTRDSRAVLLLYAREGELGQLCMAALRDLIQHSTGGTVYDVFSPEVMALCGAAPQSWLRELLRRDDVRVLLVQSPATAALYQDQLYEDDAGLRLREPLLGRRAMYRAPHYGDQLLKMALRQIAETADKHQEYKKYYLATYIGLETDILPAVVSYRRYVLPDAAQVLAADLAHAQPDPDRLAALAQAAHALLAHVQHNPNYLMDEIFIK